MSKDSVAQKRHCLRACEQDLLRQALCPDTRHGAGGRSVVGFRGTQFDRWMTKFFGLGRVDAGRRRDVMLRVALQRGAISHIQ